MVVSGPLHGSAPQLCPEDDLGERKAGTTRGWVGCAKGCSQIQVSRADPTKRKAQPSGPLLGSFLLQ